MILGIVGSEAKKFTKLGEMRTKLLLINLISYPNVTGVVSGGCHLGGVDLWAIETAKIFKKSFQEFLPDEHSWEFYKKRNLEIVNASDEVHCITVDSLPENYDGLTFRGCYHCNSLSHIKSGGCWTMKQAKKLGKRGELHIIMNT